MSVTVIIEKSKCCNAVIKSVMKIDYATLEGQLGIGKFQYVFCSKCKRKLNSLGNWILPVEFHK